MVLGGEGRSAFRRTLSRRPLLLAVFAAVAISLPFLHESVGHEGLRNGLTGAESASASSEHHAGAVTDPSVLKRTIPKKRPTPCPRNMAPMIKDGFPQPKGFKSKFGRLSVALNAANVPTQINGNTYLSPTYNGQFPGPLLTFCPGDKLNILVNDQLNPADFSGPHVGDTSLHTHGFHVSPRPPHDDIFLEIPSGGSAQYKYPIPNDHPPGAYWYHSHLHGQSNQQVFGGMAGPMIIRGGLDVQKGYRDIGTRVLVINQTKLGESETIPGTTILPEPQGPFIPPDSQIFVNGQLNPQIDIAPGELQRWRIFNISAGVFVNLRLQGQPFRVLANDGNNLVRRTKESSLLISPSSRREVLVQGGPAGSYELIAQPFAQFGPGAGNAPGVPATLATLNSSGKRVDDPMPPGRLNFRQPDLRGRKINSWHSIKYTQGPPNFFINGQQFSGEQNVAQRMKLGRVAKWKITNSTPFWHTFHIHINDFQIIQQNGHPVNNKNFDDNVAVSPNGGSVTMLYKPREFTGRFVFHCHILGHEDNGMMAVVQVQKGDVPPRQ